MNKEYRLLKKIEEVGLSVSDIAKELGIQEDQFYLKIENNMDFLSAEISKLSELLLIEKPYNFFYS